IPSELKPVREILRDGTTEVVRTPQLPKHCSPSSRSRCPMRNLESVFPPGLAGNWRNLPLRCAPACSDGASVPIQPPEAIRKILDCSACLRQPHRFPPHHRI